MLDSSDIVREAEGTEQEWRRRRITSKLGFLARLRWVWRYGVTLYR